MNPIETETETEKNMGQAMVTTESREEEKDMSSNNDAVIKDKVSKGLFDRIGDAKRKAIKLGISAVVLILILIAAGICGANSANKKAEARIEELRATVLQQEEQIQSLKEEPIVVSKTSPEIVMDIIKSSINDISELATIEYIFTDASKFSDSKQIKNWNIPFTEKSFIIKWDGVIKAGIDLEKVDVTVSEKDKKLLYLFLPPKSSHTRWITTV